MRSLNSSGVDMETERLEAAILKTIDHLKKSHDLKMHVDRKYLRYLSSLRNQVAAYKLDRTQFEVDDLVFAILRDDALTIEQIKIAFDLNDMLFAMMIERMRERDRL